VSVTLEPSGISHLDSSRNRNASKLAADNRVEALKNSLALCLLPEISDPEGSVLVDFNSREASCVAVIKTLVNEITVRFGGTTLIDFGV
jgi:hypothetical protein